MTKRDRRLRLGLACMASAWLAACAPSEDPGRAGFFDGLQNLSSGTYDRRAAEQDRRLHEAERIKRELQGDITAQQERNRGQQREIVAMQARVAAMDRDLGALERRVADLRRRNRENQELVDAERRVRALRREQQSLAAQPSPPPERVDQVGRELDSVVDALRRLNRPE